MTSAINYLSINENFPIAGQDNDTQVFRDNFDTIKNNFRSAQEEITDLQTFTVRVDSDNDFNNFKIVNALLQRTAEVYSDNGNFQGAAIDWENSSYQRYVISGSVNVQFQNLYQENEDLEPRVGRITVELVSATNDGATINFLSSGGTVIKKSGFPAATEETAGFDLVLTSATDPIIIEVWQHSSDTLFIRYVGEFV
jgi:hypothetical protein